MSKQRAPMPPPTPATSPISVVQTPAPAPVSAATTPPPPLSWLYIRHGKGEVFHDDLPSFGIVEAAFWATNEHLADPWLKKTLGLSADWVERRPGIFQYAGRGDAEEILMGMGMERIVFPGEDE